MKILFIGDYSNLHATLATELTRMGHYVTLVSDRCGYMDTHSDIFLKREPGLLGSFKYLYGLLDLLPNLKNYDAVQLINSNFLSLRPGKIKYFFDRLRSQNNKVFLTLAGNDYFFCKACFDDKIFKFSEFKVNGEFTEFHKSNPAHLFGWISPANRKWSEYLYEKIDGAMSVLPEYDIAAKPIIGEKVTFTNLPIDLSSLPVPRLSVSKPANIFLGMRSGMEIQKGTAQLLKMARDMEGRYPDLLTVQKVSDLPLKKYLELMNNASIVIDQLYAYSPAMNALYAMALGKVAATGAQPEYYEYIGNPDIKPIFSLSPTDNDIETRLLELIKNPVEILEMGKQSRKIVELQNDSKIVAQRFLNVWQKALIK